MSNNRKAVVVGCGGLFYHGMSILAKNYDELVLIDHDVIQEGNVLRQWGQVGEHKVKVASRVMGVMAGIHCVPIPYSFEDVFIYDIIEALGVGRVDFIALPDNNRARRLVWEYWMKVNEVGHKKWERGDFYTAGNDTVSGQCIGVCDNWEEMNFPSSYVSTITEDEEVEEEHVSCQQGVIELQTYMSNHMTMQCLGRTIAKVRRDRSLSAWFWKMGEKNGVETIEAWDDSMVIENDGSVIESELELIGEME